jgi:hypothetical protein
MHSDVVAGENDDDKPSRLLRPNDPSEGRFAGPFA